MILKGVYFLLNLIIQKEITSHRQKMGFGLFYESIVWFCLSDGMIQLRAFKRLLILEVNNQFKWFMCLGMQVAHYKKRLQCCFMNDWFFILYDKAKSPFTTRCINAHFLAGIFELWKIFKGHRSAPKVELLTVQSLYLNFQV